jgi:hypothetical protein
MRADLSQPFRIQGLTRHLLLLPRLRKQICSGDCIVTVAAKPTIFNNGSSSGELTMSRRPLVPKSGPMSELAIYH